MTNKHIRATTTHSGLCMQCDFVSDTCKVVKDSTTLKLHPATCSACRLPGLWRLWVSPAQKCQAPTSPKGYYVARRNPPNWWGQPDVAMCSQCQVIQGLCMIFCRKKRKCYNRLLHGNLVSMQTAPSLPKPQKSNWQACVPPSHTLFSPT